MHHTKILDVLCFKNGIIWYFKKVYNNILNNVITV